MSIQHTRPHSGAQAALARMFFGSQVLLYACGLSEVGGLAEGESAGAGGTTPSVHGTGQGTAGALAGGSDPAGGAGGGDEDGGSPADSGAQPTDDGGCSNGDDASCTPCATPGSCNTTGLRLYWKLDEMTGITAIDSSGNDLTGTYVGVLGLPTGALDVPDAVTKWDSTSLSFQGGTYRHAVVIAATATPNFAQLKITNNVTFSVWYRSKAAEIDSGGSEILSLGDHYILRLGKTTTYYRLEFNKQVNLGTSTAYSQCHHLALISAGTPPFLDGNWHHFAAISSNAPPGMALYYDGTLFTCEFSMGAPYATNDIYYEGLGQDFWLGRHGNAKETYDFQGNLDDVRIYDRVLSAEEIQALAQGSPLLP